MLLSALALALFASPSPLPLSSSTDRPIVARFECAAPEAESFFLRGTLPLPAGHGFVLEGPGSIEPFQFKLVGSGVLIPAQSEIVVRRPDGTPEVIELIARVAKPDGAKVDDRLQYDVVLEEAVPDEIANKARPQVPLLVRQLLSEEAPETLLLRTKDVYGNVYTVDLCGASDANGFGSERILKSGHALRETRVYGTLAPSENTEGSDGPPLTHLMGVHAYLREWSGAGFVDLDLRINNGATPGSKPDPHPTEQTLGIVYWDAIELLVPRGWTVIPDVRDPFFGPAYDEGEHLVFPIVRPYEDGALHMMGPQAQFHRRLVVSRKNALKLAREHLHGAGRAFCVRGEGLWSWFEPETASYFAQRELLSPLDFWQRGRGLGTAAVRREDTTDAGKLRSVIAGGAASGYGYVKIGVMGWAHPWFIRIEGGAGGEGIAIVEGHRAAGAASVGDVQRLQYLHRMNQSRQPEAQYDRYGDPVGYHAWLDENGRVPFDFRTNGRVVPPAFKLPSAWGPKPSSQVLDVVERGLRPPYDRGEPYKKQGRMLGEANVLIAWSPHDGQHMIRYTKQTKALVWLTNDSLAKDDLLLSAELFRLMWHESPHKEASWGGGITLHVGRKAVDEHPGQGLYITRDHAWGIDSMAAAYSTQSAEWRERQKPWFEHVSRLLVDAATPGGIVERNHNTKILQTDKYYAAQSFECLFLLHALRGVMESVYEDSGVAADEVLRSSLQQLLLRTVEYMFWGPIFVRFQPPYQPDPKNPSRFFWGPRAGFGVAMKDNYATPPFSDEEHWGEDYMPPDALKHDVDVNYNWQALSYAEELTRETHGTGLENRYLKRALDCWLQFETWEGMLAEFYRTTSQPSVENSKNWIGFVAKVRNLVREKGAK